MPLSDLQEKAVAALMSSRTLEDAAATPGLEVSERQLRRWLKDDGEFRGAHREARQEAIRLATARLAALTGEAVAALERNLACRKPSAEIRAALGVWELTLRAAQLEDHEERLTAVEARLAAEPARNGRARRG
jgi:hypothetical protein